MTDQYTELRQALAGARTPTPWKCEPSFPEEGVNCYWIVRDGKPAYEIGAVNGPQGSLTEPDAAIIIAAVNAAPSLLAERDRLREALKKIENEAAVFGGGFGGWVVDVAREALKEQQ